MNIMVFSSRLCLSCRITAAQTAEDKAGLGIAADLNEPAGGLGEEPDGPEEDAKGNDLEGDGEPPREGRGPVVDKGEAELEPVGHDDTKDVEGELDGDELAARGVFGRLCRPYGYDGVEDTRTDSIYGPCCLCG